MVEDVGIAAVPGSSFFSAPASGSKWVRFCFAKKPETIAAAAERLSKLER
jgi:aminotransferase